MRWALKTLALLASAVLLPSLAFAQYTRTDLVTDSGTGGTVQDAHLVNAWGLVSTMTSPFWVSDNGKGVSTLYAISNNANGITATPQGLVVSIPSVGSGSTGPTGIVAPETPKGGTDFTVSIVNPVTGKKTSGPAAFIFATLDGTISGWNPGVGGTSATLAVDNSSLLSTYTGLAIATNNGQKLLYAADDGSNRRVDVFDSSSNPPIQPISLRILLSTPKFRGNSLPMAFRPSPPRMARKRFGSPILRSTNPRVVLWTPSPPRALWCLTLP